MTLIECVRATSARLASAGVSFGHGTANAFDEAAWLVLWCLGLPLDALDEHRARVLRSDETVRIEALVGQRIATRRPAAYLTGEAWLQGVPFTVDDRAIVPRSLIAEVLVGGGIDPWLPDELNDLLDLCTGNGSLAVLAAMTWPGVRIDATDLSDEALAVARLNLERHRLAGRIRLWQGDGLAAVAGRRYELVLCNPPYVTEASMAALPPEYRAEPRLALAGGADGMDFVRRLVGEASSHLTEDGVLVLEIGHGREPFERAFPRLEAVWLPTSAGDDQVLVLNRAALSAANRGDPSP